jgi:hypothetical protein
MRRAIQKARDFTADFENVFGWYVDKAGMEHPDTFTDSGRPETLLTSRCQNGTIEAWNVS